MKILIADDFPEVTRVMRYMLKNIGFRNVREADGGKAVLRALKKEKYDLIFCDWAMPDMSGKEVLKIIRSDDELKDLPFVMVTAAAEKEKILAAIKAGVSSYIVKPFTADTISATLKKVLCSRAKKKPQDLFNKILEKHMERLIGTSHGIGAMPLNPATISYLTLLMERENEIDSFPSDPPERYTSETLICEFSEMGFELDQHMPKIAQDMIQKGYVYVEDDGRLTPEKPARSMTQLLDRALPGMAGMNFVAYFIQTLDEVKSERKDLGSAVSQFDQMLHMLGVPLKNMTATT